MLLFTQWHDTNQEGFLMQQIELLSDLLNIKRSSSIHCRHCDSSNLSFTKHMNWGPKLKAFHYRVHCKDCKKSYHVERTQEIYELVKDQKWIYSKNAKKRLAGKLR